MKKLLGANWQTTLWGGIFAVSTAIAASPTLVSFLPERAQNYVRGFAGIIVAASGVKFAIEAKSRNVTGGTVQQTASGDVARPSTKSVSVVDTVSAKSSLDIPEGRGL